MLSDQQDINSSFKTVT